MSARTDADLPSKSQINKAGVLLATGVRDATPEQLYAALDVVQAFRDAHAYPMVKVRLGLSSFLNTVGAQNAVSQRHKRVPRIIRKLRRMPNSMLARLEDIGGCRAVVGSPDELERVRAHIYMRWSEQIVRERDYIDKPKEMGYRAVHIVVERDGRRIEIQLRTVGQQRWADAIEELDARRGLNLKDGDATPVLLRYFQGAGELIYRREYHLPVDAAFVQNFIDSRDAVIADGHYSG